MSDAWDKPLETGLRDDYDGTVVNAFFGTDERYNNGETMLLKWEVHGLDEDGVAYEETQLITVGKGWETVDGGQTVRHESGKDRMFNNNSHLGKIIERCTKELGIGDVLRSKGSPYDAKVWVGLSFHFNREEQRYSGSSEVKDTTKLMPTKYLGENAIDLGGATQATPSPVGDQAAASSNGNEQVLRAKLTAAAKSSGTHQEFLDKAIEIDGVVANESLLAEIMDEAQFYTTARG